MKRMSNIYIYTQLIHVVIVRLNTQSVNRNQFHEIQTRHLQRSLPKKQPKSSVLGTHLLVKMSVTMAVPPDFFGCFNEQTNLNAA